MATVRKRNKLWQVQIRKEGHRPISKSFIKKLDAEKWARDVESKIDLGTYLDISEARRRLLRDVIDEYISKILPKKKATKCELSRCKLLQVRLGNLSLASLRPSHLAQYRDSRITEVSSQSVRHELGLLGRILNIAIKEWDINLPHGNPIGKIKLPKCAKARERRLETGEIERLKKALTQSYEMQAIVDLVLETGMRRGEICGMKWDHIDFSSSTIFIPDTKTGVSRKIPLSQKAQDILRSLPRRIDGLIFSLCPDSITQAFDRACKRVEIEDLRFHDLRHEATSRLFEKGLSVMEVASISGHKDLRMLQRYTHLRAEDLAKKLG